LARRRPDILEEAENGLSWRLRALLERLRRRWATLDIEIEEVTSLLNT